MEKLALRFSELLCFLLLTLIYGINNNSLRDIEGPGEESGCGRGRIVSLLRGKKKKDELFPQVSYRGSNALLPFVPDGLAASQMAHAA